MKNLKLLIYFFVGLVAVSCSEDDGPSLIEIETPSNIDATFMIAQDNSGEVTITPSATGASSFIVEFGDDSGASETFAAGEQVTHTYEEGSYEVTIIAFNQQGSSASATKMLEVSFVPPTNLEVTITQNENEPNVEVAATADNASMFNVDFGDESEMVSFMMGETATYEYSEAGTYTITVTAVNSSSETVSYSEEIEVEITGPDPNAIAIPLTFEGDPESYVFTEFEGAPTTVVANPDTNGNSSAQVGMTERALGAANYAGAFIILEENPDLANNNVLTMKVWSPAAGIPVTLRFEDPSDNTMGVEAAANTTVANQWETLTFNYSGANASQDYTKMVLFFNLGTDGQGNTYYFDDIQYGEGGGEEPAPVTFPLSFEDPAENYVFTEFEGAPTSVVANPDTNGNSSAQVAMTERVAGAANYAGAFIILENGPDLINNSTITIKVWSPAVGIPVTLRFEDPTNNTNGVEAAANTTVANEWETLTLDYSGANDSQGYTKMVIFFNLGTVGQGNIYYFDDIQYGEGGGEEPNPITFPLSFEDSDVNYVWTAFGGNSAQVINNPDMSGINTSSMVTEMVKPVGAETWSGASIILDQPIDVTGSTTFSMKVWSPAAGTPVLLKLEEDATDYAMEVQATTTTANQWEELTFDFTGISTTNDIDVISIFMNFNVAGQGNTYYLDDIQLQ